MSEHIKVKNRNVNIDTLIAFSTVLGVLVGVIISFQIDSRTLASVCSFGSTFSSIASGKWMSVFADSFLRSLIWILLAFVFGFGAIYQPASVLLLVFRGLGLGACMRGVYLTDDVLRNLAVFLPAALASLGVLILQVRQSLRLSSMYLFLTVTDENRIGLRRESRDYFVRFLIYLLMLLVISALECIILRLVTAV